MNNVIDTTTFEIETLEVLSANHRLQTWITNRNIAEFNFEGIELPFEDDTNDGFVSFKINTKLDLVLGDSIKIKPVFILILIPPLLPIRAKRLCKPLQHRKTISNTNLSQPKHRHHIYQQ